MEKVLALCGVLINGALLVHIHELLLGDLLVEVLVELPDHPLYFGFAHPDAHAFEGVPDLLGGEVLVGVPGRELLKHLQQVLLLRRVDLKLFQLFFDGLFLLGLALLEFLEVELELGVGQPVLLFEDDGVFVLLLEVHGQIPVSNLLLLLFQHRLYYKLRPILPHSGGGCRRCWRWSLRVNLIAIKFQ